MIDCLLLEGITDWTKRTPRWDPEVGPLVNAEREASFCCHLVLQSLQNLPGAQVTLPENESHDEVTGANNMRYKSKTTINVLGFYFCKNL